MREIEQLARELQVDAAREDEQQLDLSQGDSVNYRSSTPHRVSNPGEAAAEVLFVISPPSY